MKSFGVLDLLVAEDFDLGLTFYSTPSALRRRLRKSDEVARLEEALERGALTEATAERFVDELQKKGLRRGVRFPYETALAALAVALERRYTEFAWRYLETLASLKLSEMTLSIGVAKLVLEQRKPRPIRIDCEPPKPLPGSKLLDPPVVPERGRWRSNAGQDLKPTGTC